MTRPLLLVGLLASAWGCAARLPEDAAERYAEAFCAAEATCGCEHYSSVDECESDVIAAFDRSTVEISDFDEECFDATLAALDSHGCVNPTEFPITCEAIVGASPVGEVCEYDHRLLGCMHDACDADAYRNLWAGTCSVGVMYLHGV